MRPPLQAGPMSGSFDGEPGSTGRSPARLPGCAAARPNATGGGSRSRPASLASSSGFKSVRLRRCGGADRQEPRVLGGRNGQLLDPSLAAGRRFRDLRKGATTRQQPDRLERPRSEGGPASHAACSQLIPAQMRANRRPRSNPADSSRLSLSASRGVNPLRQPVNQPETV